ncbi:YeeE/YedE family protein [Polynucleobacter sp. IMCC30063]|uniref:YeeE/YedE family protein n=1 Tax=Polynucleobacter sp. IMCC30063 TaxID=2907298 RepID=UPI001F1B8EDE|nr:YeeE/YedE thiosulfate transporter family protein [Polynucleobacter sp. IMCC30063]MCE7506077.1 YeeE/YedE family protein [Polynucleobacter sp. IMCC30063]
MHIDWTVFTPFPALLGGIILGLAAALYIHLHGRILGVSGIVGGLTKPEAGDWLWRLSFVFGLLSSPLWASLIFDVRAIVVIDAGWGALIVAGLLVGFGASYGAGCTSGHGICGISRLSLSSLVATITFMCTGFLTVFLLRHVF